jgi:holo-[acyl-carrier protein] synthase
LHEWNIGIDVVDIARFERINYFNYRAFYERVFTRREIDYCLSFKDPAPHFAASFAGKEAVYKAIEPCSHEVWEIELLRDSLGAPHVRLNPIPVTEERQRLHVRVSLSHSSSYAVAIALAYADRKRRFSRGG